MADYSWFRLLVRAMGIMFIGIAVPELIHGTSGLAGAISDGYPLTAETVLTWGGYILGCLLQLAIGLYLFFRGNWIIERSLRGVYGYCPACTYDLSGHPGSLCPECGISLPGRSAPTSNSIPRE